MRRGEHLARGVRPTPAGTAELGTCLAAIDMSDLEVVPYASDRLALVTHMAHPLAGRTEVAFEETLDYPFVALNPESGTTRLLSGLAARKGRLMDHRIYVSTFEAASHVIAENLAIGILAEDAVCGWSNNRSWPLCLMRHPSFAVLCPRLELAAHL